MTRVTLLLGVALLLAACATRHYPANVTVHYTDDVTILCNESAGCAMGNGHVYCSHSDMLACDHEVYDHWRDGLVHTTPVDHCFIVTNPGRTRFHKDARVCRDQYGFFTELKP